MISAQAAAQMAKNAVDSQDQIVLTLLQRRIEEAAKRGELAIDANGLKISHTVRDRLTGLGYTFDEGDDVRDGTSWFYIRW